MLKSVQLHLCVMMCSQVNERDMLTWLVKYSPLTVSVNARSWQDYDGIIGCLLAFSQAYFFCVVPVGGIIQHHCSGFPESVDHAVQVVGYDLTGKLYTYNLQHLDHLCLCFVLQVLFHTGLYGTHGVQTGEKRAI